MIDGDGIEQRQEATELRHFLHRDSAIAAEMVGWAGMQLRALAHLTRDSPPLSLVTAGRAIDLRGDDVLVQEDVGARHTLPRGQREGGESLETTLLRKIHEERGWTVRDFRPLGFLHFLHLHAPKLDMPHLVNATSAVDYAPECMLTDDVEVGTAILSMAVGCSLPVTRIEQLFLDAT